MSDLQLLPALAFETKLLTRCSLTQMTWELGILLPPLSLPCTGVAESTHWAWLLDGCQESKLQSPSLHCADCISPALHFTLLKGVNCVSVFRRAIHEPKDLCLCICSFVSQPEDKVELRYFLFAYLFYTLLPTVGGHLNQPELCLLSFFLAVLSKVVCLYFRLGGFICFGMEAFRSNVDL